MISIDAVLAVSVTALASVFLGTPVALVLRRRRDGWAALTADALLIGFLLVALAPALVSWVGAAGLAPLGAIWVAAIVLAIVRRSPLPMAPRPDTRTRWLFAGGVAVAIVALVMRLEVVEFLPWIGDMGAYVDWAGQYVRTGELTAKWPPLMPAYLALSGAVFGVPSLTASLGLAGLVLIVGVARLLHLIGVNRWVVLLVAALVAVNGHAIWYSTFPASETLNAPLFVIWVLTIARALRSRRFAEWAVLSGLAMLALGLLRGTGPFLLIPLGLLGVLTWFVPDWRHLARRVWWLLAAGVAGALLTYWYGITEIRSYYVDLQMADLLPGSLLGTLRDLGVVSPSPATALGLVTATAIVVVIAILAGRWSLRPSAPTRAPRVLGWVLAGSTAAGVLASAVIGAATWTISLRMAFWLLPLAVLALVLAALAADRLPRRDYVLVLVLGSVLAIFYALQTYRLTFHLDHSFFLYWDRYLVSEVLPVAFLLSGWALSRLLGVLTRRWDPERVDSRARLVVIVPALVLATVVATLPQLPTLILEAQDTYLDGTGDFYEELEDYAADDPETPIVWASTSDAYYTGFAFPNTWMAFGRPLAYVGGYDLVRVRGRDEFGSDEVLDAAMLEEAIACGGDGRVRVFEVQTGEPDLARRVDTPDLAVTREGEVDATIALLSQPPVLGGWVHLKFHVVVWEVEASGPVDASCSA